MMMMTLDVYNMLHMTSILVTPWKWLWFAAEILGAVKPIVHIVGNNLASVRQLRGKCTILNSCMWHSVAQNENIWTWYTWGGFNTVNNILIIIPIPLKVHIQILILNAMQYLNVLTLVNINTTPNSKYSQFIVSAKHVMQTFSCDHMAVVQCEMRQLWHWIHLKKTYKHTSKKEILHCLLSITWFINTVPIKPI